MTKRIRRISGAVLGERGGGERGLCGTQGRMGSSECLSGLGDSLLQRRQEGKVPLVPFAVMERQFDSHEATKTQSGRRQALLTLLPRGRRIGNLAAAALAQAAGCSWMSVICRWVDAPLWFGKTSPDSDQTARGQGAGGRRFFSTPEHIGAPSPYSPNN